MAQEDVEIIRRGYEAFNRDGPESIYERLDPEVEWRNPPESMDRNVWRGHEGVAAWFRDIAYQQFEWMRFHPERFIDLGARCWSCAAPSSAPLSGASQAHSRKPAAGQCGFHRCCER